MHKYLILFFFLVSFFSYAQEKGRAHFSQDNEYLFETKLNEGIPLAEGLLGYKYSREWFFPLYELTSKLGLGFSTSPEKNLIEGDIVLNSLHFELDLMKCLVRLNKKEESFDCSKVVSYNEEIYIAQSLYEKWFPLVFKVEELKSLLLIEAKEEFPILKKLKRAQADPEGKASVSGEIDYGYPVVTKPSHKLDGFSGEVLLGTNYTKKKETSSQETSYQANLGAELLGFETRLDLVGKDKNLESWYLNFRKVDEKGGLLGPLKTKQIDLYHFYFPSFPLVGGFGIVKGAALTNRSPNQPSSFSKHDFQGELLPEWDVELYQNNLLIGRQVGNSTGLYSFKDVALLYGVNRFELIFYGPLGQEKHEYKTFRIDSTIPNSKQLLYRAAFGATDDGQELKALSFEKALFGRLSLNTTYTETFLPNEMLKRNYLVGGLNGFADSFFYSFMVANELDKGSAYQGSIAIPYRMVNFKFDHTRLDHFSSREFSNNYDYNPLTNQSKLEVFLPVFSRLMTRTLFLRDQYEDKQKVDRIHSFLSFNYSLWGFDNEAEWDSSSRAWITEPSFRLMYKNNTLRLSTKYQEAFGFMSYKTELRNNLSNIYDLLLSYSRDLVARQNEYAFALTRFFEKYSLSFQSTVNSSDAYSVALNLNFGFVREPQENQMVVVKNSLRDRGSLTVLIFEDLNQNGLRDPNEKILPNVQARILQTNQVETANDKGILFFTDLPLYTNLDVVLVPKSLPNIQYRPLEKGYRFAAAAGSSNRMEIPVGLFGDLDGSVLVKRKGKPPLKRGVLVTLLSPSGEVMRELRTDSDGYYTMEGLKPGAYTVVASINNVTQKKEITISPTGDFLGGIDFIFDLN